MITGIVRLPDLSGLGSYENTILTPFGISGRKIEISKALAFYKIIVTHGNCTIEYVAASTQNFNTTFRCIEERMTGQLFDKPDNIHIVPISMKLIAPDFCDNYLFVEPMSYLLTYCGTVDYNDPNHISTISFSNPPTNLTTESYCEMCDADACGLVSMNTLVESLSDNCDLVSDVPNHTYSLDLSYIMNILRNRNNGKLELKNIITVNDYGVYRWLFDTLEYANNFVNDGRYPLLPDANFSLIRERFDKVRNIVLSEPLCGAFVVTPSVINLWNFKNYFVHQHTLDLYNGLANDLITSNIAQDSKYKTIVLDSKLPEFSMFDIRDLIDAIIFSPVTDIQLKVVKGNVITELVNGWFGYMHPNLYGGITGWLRRLYNTIMFNYKTDSIIIKFDKNWLDEIRLSICVNGMETHFYIPMWYYNLSSPYAINDTLITAMSKVFGKI